MRWTDVSTDPNSPDAIRYRHDQLSGARQAISGDRRSFMTSAARGKRVLELGCVDHDFDLRTDWWLHGILAETAAELIGVDYDETGVAKMQTAGFKAILADVTKDTSALQEHGRFELIVAGEIIEHVDRPQSILEVAVTLLAPSGRLMITTPNPYAPWRVRAGQRGETWENVDHVTYLFPSGMAELADRAGMRLVSFGSLNITGRRPSIRASAREWLSAARRGTRPPAVWISPLDVAIMRARRGVMLDETAVYVLEVA